MISAPPRLSGCTHCTMAHQHHISLPLYSHRPQPSHNAPLPRPSRITGPQQHALSVDQLQVELAKNISPALTSWLNTLYDGTAAALKHLPDLQAAAAAQQQQPLLQSLRHHGSSGDGCGSNGGAAAVPAVTDALLQHIMDVVRYNAYSDLHDDLAAAAAAGQEPVALIGLYPGVFEGTFEGEEWCLGGGG